MQLVLNILLSFATYSIIGLGFWMLYKTHKFFNLGHGAFVTIGGYCVFLLSQKFLGTTVTGISISIVIAVIVAGFIGMIIDETLYRLLRNRKQSSLVLLVVSLGLMTIVQNIIALGFTSQYRVVDTAESFSRVFQIAGGSITLIQIVSIITAIIIAIGFYFVILKTNFGKAFRAVSDDVDVSAIVGIPVERVLLMVAGIAAALAGLAGAFIGTDTGILPTLGFAVFLKAVVSDIIGGLDNYWGVVVGALIVAILENLVVFKLGAQWRDVAAYTLLLIFLLVRPQGILTVK
jgi:branched-subunit amino acid ABC-type transport system permease component